MSSDAKTQGIISTDFAMESPEIGEGGDILNCSYKLPDGKTRASISLVTSKSDEEFIEADNLLRARDNAQIDAKLKLGFLSPEEADAAREEIDPQIEMLAGHIYLSPEEMNVLSVRKQTSRDPVKSEHEVWNIFKVVRNSKVELRLATDDSIVEPRYTDEKGARLVSELKLKNFMGQLEQATFRRGSFTPGDQTDDVDALSNLITFAGKD